MNRAALLEVAEATWPAEQRIEEPPWIFRKSPGGGKRVTAATATGQIDAQDVRRAEARMHAMGQPALFSVLPGDQTDTVLLELGYHSVDETWLYHAPIGLLTQHPVPPVTAFPLWPPLQVARDIWQEGGIGPDRVAVMERANCTKTAILGRVNGRAGGVLYAGLHEGCVMIHALEVLLERRRAGLARSLVIAAAHWGAEQGATDIALLVTQANAPANALYRALGMDAEQGYHYRVEPPERPPA